MRKTEQYLLPEMKPLISPGSYDIYPSFHLNENLILSGIESLSEKYLNSATIIVDGYVGVFFDHFQKKLDENFKRLGKKTSWKNTSDFLKPPEVINELISPFMGGDDPLFGTRTTLNISDFFELQSLKSISPDPAADINIIIGPGASLSCWNGLNIYLDLPKNEIQYKSRSGSVTNLGAVMAADPGEMYKRFYFVDWIVLNKHKKDIFPCFDIYVDTQNAEDPSWIEGDIMRKSLSALSKSAFRARPWFEPGVWGGSWIMDHIEGLNKDLPNYAWSFELIVPENGLLLESSGRMLEISFDCLMFQEAQNVLGDCFEKFGAEFPIRFDFLDTFDGGNLSVQCHPRTDYMKKHFGEEFTQEESYYILDTKEKAVVYLGFQEDIVQSEFRSELKESLSKGKSLNIEKYVQKLPASKHDLFLIPYGTIHGSGKNNVVLEISTTPYIFTFKMYDWLRPDLNGKPRQLNISRGMENLFFDRKGQYVEDKLISHPVMIEEGENFQLWHLPTHETHLYDVHRYHFTGTVEIKTENKCHVMSLVEGTGIIVETSNGHCQQFNYAETFIIPAAAGSYKIINGSDGMAIIVKTFVK
jgi:mannose-6-phosphate isomerase class I